MLGVPELALVMSAFTLGLDVAFEKHFWAALMLICVMINAYVLGWFAY
jgi:hypothetical protein